MDKDRSFLPIVIFVLVAHACLILFLALFSPVHIIKKRDPVKFVVKTVKLSPKPEVFSAPIAEAEPLPVATVQEEVTPSAVEPAAAPPLPPPPPIEKPENKVSEKLPAPPPPAPPKPKPQVKPQPVKKKIAPKKSIPAPNPLPVKSITSPKKINPAPTPPPKPPDNSQAKARETALIQQKQQKQRELLSKAREKIANIDSHSTKISASGSLASAKLPSSLKELNIDNLFQDSAESLTVRERGYRDELAARLKLMLKLPEYGVVKIKLTINREGTVASVDVLSSKSQANKEHVKITLPKIHFPPFGEQFSGQPHYTFQINLSSE